ncbi:unnamed protein product [Euphydryas editha]|uniref:Uncharacterized protein n=1 Tax=Euphydryas editha TaxID=104508 RepID=A0AAU9TIF1_EUPED|nr:unnamed protein product [Euphydryas editha]
MYGFKFSTRKTPNPKDGPIAASTSSQRKQGKKRSDQWSYEIIKANLKLKEPCKKCRMKCNTKVSEEIRARLYDEFFQLEDLTAQRNFVSKFVKRIKKRRFTTENIEDSQRVYTYRYFLPVADETTIRVCKIMLLHTLGLTSRTIKTVLGYRDRRSS